MKRRREISKLVLAGLALMLLILDAKTALSGAKDGISLCIYTVIPSLFPFFILSSMLTSSLTGKRIPILSPISRLCGIPDGAESLLVLGILGGYPVGAQAIADAYEQGQLKKTAAHRLLGFCSNAGPAFLFGMAGTLFNSVIIPWALWLIHILSALIVGAILPGKTRDTCQLRKSAPLTVPQTMERSIRIMATVCGWVVIFRVILAVLNRWVFWFLPLEGQILLSGLLELSNGCVALHSLQADGSRFVLCACILAIGGLCVGMQTVSVTAAVGTGLYFPGKVLQCLISVLMAAVVQCFLFLPSERMVIPTGLYICTFAVGSALTLCLHRRKKVVAMCV